jgi:PST family polysaccharide transporter
MIGFGANITGFHFLNYFARCGDNLLIGRVWGEVPLGLYDRSYKLMIAPLHQISTPLAHLLIPALSRLNHQPAAYRSAYFRALGVFQVVSCPLMAFLAVMAPHVVQVVLGPRFAEAAPILRWLAIAGFAQPLSNSLGWLYASQGRGRELMRWGLVGCPLILLSFVIGIPWGPLGVARAYAGMICFVIIPLAISYAGAQGPVSRADLWRMVGIALLLSTPCAAASLLVVSLWQFESPAVAILVAAVASLLAIAPVVVFTSPGRSLVWQFKDIAEHLLHSSKRSQPLPPAPTSSPGVN